MGLGSYPTISLAEARIEHERCRKLVAQGIDPRTERKQVLRPETFREATDKYFELKSEGLKGGGLAGRWLSPINTHIIPKIGDKPVAQLTLDDLVDVLKPIWKTDTGRKAHDRLSQIMTNAKARTPDVLHDVADVKKSIKHMLPHVRRTNTNHPSLDWELMPKLWVSLGDSVVYTGFKFYLLNLPRTSNVTKMTWSEVDWKKKVWDIPPSRMKGDIGFSAPLARQSIELLKFAKESFKADNDFVFPSPAARKHGVISANTWGDWLEDNKWNANDGRHAVPHGFRATFGTWCGDNQVCDIDMQKRCIQHVVEKPEDAAYLRSKLLPQRLKVMQEWADFVTSLEDAQLQKARKQKELNERLDQPHERADAKGQRRTEREVMEWLREDSVEQAEAAEHDERMAKDIAWSRQPDV